MSFLYCLCSKVAHFDMKRRRSKMSIVPATRRFQIKSNCKKNVQMEQEITKGKILDKHEIHKGPWGQSVMSLMVHCRLLPSVTFCDFRNFRNDELIIFNDVHCYIYLKLQFFVWNVSAHWSMQLFQLNEFLPPLSYWLWQLCSGIYIK